MNVSFERKFFSSRSFFGGPISSFDDDDDRHATVAPTNLIAFAWMMQRPDALAGPATLHVQFGVNSSFESI